jgi:hypothetical protein
MKTRWMKVADIGWMIATLIFILLVLVSGAQTQKYDRYRLSGQDIPDKEKGLTKAEKFVLAQAEKGKTANLLSGLVEQIPDKQIQKELRNQGLALYMDQLKTKGKEEQKTFKEFLNKFHKRLGIRAQFLETLLTGGFPGFKIDRHGVHISNAIITGPLDFAEIEVEHSFSLTDSILGRARFLDCWFKQNLVLNRSVILEKAVFERAKIGKDFFLRGARFLGPVDFMGADINGVFDANGAKFLNKYVKVTFSGMKVGQDAIFDNTAFLGPVDFSLVDIKANFSASGAKFYYVLTEKEKTRLKELKGKEKARYLNGLNEQLTTRFNGMKVGQSAFFRKTRFEPPVNFGLADVKVNFVADEADFLNKELGAIFNSMKVSHTIHLKKVNFWGPVNFVSAEIGSQFNANDAWFLNKAGAANFSGLKVGKHALFKNAQFYGPANFSVVDIKGDFVAYRSQFLSETYTADFNGMKVGGLASFEGDRFQGPVSFASAYIGNQFIAVQAQFTNAVKEVTFNRMKVGQTAFFDYTKFYGPVSFSLVNITGNFWATGTQFFNKVTTADFNTMKVGQTARFNKAYFHGPLDLGSAEIGELDFRGAQYLGGKAEAKFNNMKVGRTVFLDDATFKGPVDMRMSSFQVLHFKDPNQVFLFKDPKFEPVKLEGMTYKVIQCEEKWKNLLEFLKKSPYSAQPYSQLASFFQESGYVNRADEVFIAGKQRELKQKRSWWNPATWFIWFFWDVLAGYGRKPFRSFGLGLVMVVLAAIFIFELKDVQLNALDNWDLEYKGKFRPIHIVNFIKVCFLKFIVSFDQFIPAIDLGLASHWEPEALPFWKWFCAYILRISGWILIPIGLAAIASQFK